MKLNSITKVRFNDNPLIPEGFVVSNYIIKGGKKTPLSGFSYTFKIEEIKDKKFLINKFILLRLGPNDCVSRIVLLSSDEKETALEILYGGVGSRIGWVVLHPNIEFTAYNRFEDIIKATQANPNEGFFFHSLRPEFTTVPSEEDTRIVLHDKLLSGNLSWGRIYRYFTTESSDKDILKKKYVIIDGETPLIAQILDTDATNNSITYEVIKALKKDPRTDVEFFGVYNGNLTEPTFNAYETFQDVRYDFLTMFENTF